MNDIILNRLLRHFRLNNESYTELDRQMCAFIFERLGGDHTVFAAIDELEAELCDAHIGAVYNHLKLSRMMGSDRYDFSTKRPPPDYSGYDRGWRL